jgi:hypothetical protein
MDDNLTYLEGLSTGLSSSISGLSFSFILGVGNTTGGNNIVMSNGDVIEAASGGGQLDLRYGGDDKVMLSTDAGAYSKEYLTMEPGYIELSAVDTGGSRINLFADEYNVGLQLGGSALGANKDFEVYGTKFSIMSDNSTFEGDGELRLSHSNYVVIDSKLYVFDDLLLLNTNAIKGGQGRVNIGGVADGTFGLGTSIENFINIGHNNSFGIASGPRENVILIGSNIDEDIESDTIYIGDNIKITNDKTINAASGDGQLDLRYGGDNKVMLSTDAGAYSKEYLTMEPGYIEISAVDTGGSRINMFADEYDVGLQLGNFGGALGADFITYGSNGFNILNHTDDLSEGKAVGLYIEHNDLISIGNKATGNDLLLTGGEISIDCLEVLLPGIPTYADNATAVAASHPTDAIYKTATGELRIVV